MDSEGGLWTFGRRLLTQFFLYSLAQAHLLDVRSIVAPVQVRKHGTGRGMLGMLQKQIGEVNSLSSETSQSAGGEGGGNTSPRFVVACEVVRVIEPVVAACAFVGALAH